MCQLGHTSPFHATDIHVGLESQDSKSSKMVVKQREAGELIITLAIASLTLLNNLLKV